MVPGVISHLTGGRYFFYVLWKLSNRGNLFFELFLDPNRGLRHQSREVTGGEFPKPHPVVLILGFEIPVTAEGSAARISPKHAAVTA